MELHDHFYLMLYKQSNPTGSILFSEVVTERLWFLHFFLMDIKHFTMFGLFSILGLKTTSCHRFHP